MLLRLLLLASRERIPEVDVRVVRTTVSKLEFEILPYAIAR
jgi:hypothetical protein